MTEKNASDLKKIMHRLGFPERLDDMIDYYSSINYKDFSVWEFMEIERDRLRYELRFKTGNDDVCHLTDYTATLKNIHIPDVTIEGINAIDLDKRMEDVDRWTDEYYSGEYEKLSYEGYQQREEISKDTNDKVLHLSSLEGEGKDLAKLLLFKYWLDCNYEK